MVVDNLHTVTLVDGLENKTPDGKTFSYKTVILRELKIAEALEAIKLSERLHKLSSGKHIVACNEELHNLAHVMLSIARFESPNAEPIPAAVIDLNLIGKLTCLDFNRIEKQVALIELAAQVRHGVITQKQFEEYQEAGERDSKRVTGSLSNDIGLNGQSGNTQDSKPQRNDANDIITPTVISPKSA